MIAKKSKYKGLMNSRLVRKMKVTFERLARKIILPGFDGIPLFDVILFFFKGIRKSSLISRANSLSFTFMLAIFPAIIFFFTLIPYIPVENLQETILNSLANIMPENAFITVESTIRDLISLHRGGLLSLGFFMALYFSSNGVMGIMKAFNRTSHAMETRSKLMLIVISLVLVAIIVSIMIVATSILVYASYLIKQYGREGFYDDGITATLIIIGKWVFTYLLIFIVISFIYYLAPAGKRHFSFISAGSTLATVLSLVFIMGFNYYIDNFSQYNKLYGSLGTLLILMLWVNLNAIALLIGFELNASILDAKTKGIKTI